MKNMIIAVALLATTLAMSGTTLAHDAKEMDELRRAIILSYKAGIACDIQATELSQMATNLNTEMIAGLQGNKETQREYYNAWQESTKQHAKWSKKCQEERDKFSRVIEMWKKQSPHLFRPKP